MLERFRDYQACSVQCLFPMATWVGLQCVIVLFPGHTHLFCQYMISSVKVETFPPKGISQNPSPYVIDEKMFWV